MKGFKKSVNEIEKGTSHAQQQELGQDLSDEFPQRWRAAWQFFSPLRSVYCLCAGHCASAHVF